MNSYLRAYLQPYFKVSRNKSQAVIVLMKLDRIGPFSMAIMRNSKKDSDLCIGCWIINCIISAFLLRRVIWFLVAFPSWLRQTPEFSLSSMYSQQMKTNARQPPSCEWIGASYHLLGSRAAIAYLQVLSSLCTVDECEYVRLEYSMILSWNIAVLHSQVEIMTRLLIPYT